MAIVSDSHVGLIHIPKWEQLLEKDMLLAYMQKLERHGVGPDGQTQKLDALDAAVVPTLALSLHKWAVLPPILGPAVHVTTAQLMRPALYWPKCGCTVDAFLACLFSWTCGSYNAHACWS